MSESRLDQFGKSLEKMSLDELTEHLRKVRADRVVRKVRKTTSKPKRREKADKIKAILDAMSEAERLAFLEKIRAGN